MNQLLLLLFPRALAVMCRCLDERNGASAIDPLEKELEKKLAEGDERIFMVASDGGVAWGRGAKRRLDFASGCQLPLHFHGRQRNVSGAQRKAAPPFLFHLTLRVGNEKGWPALQIDTAFCSIADVSNLFPECARVRVLGESIFFL